MKRIARAHNATASRGDVRRNVKRKLLAICGTLVLITGLGMTADLAAIPAHAGTHPGISKKITYDYIEHGAIDGSLSGYVADDPNNSTTNGTWSQVWHFHNVTQEKWSLAASPQGSGYYIMCLANGMCLDDTNGSSQNGTKVQMWADLGDKAQSWTWIPIGTHGQYEIVNWYGACLDLTNDSNSDGTHLQMWGCQADNSQYWAYVIP